MKSRATKSVGKVPVNLSLTANAIRKGRQLQKVMNRPSLSNVVEELIEEKDRQVAEKAA